VRVPSSTYRLQLTPGFGFAEAREILGYLEDLGVGDLYLSPIFEARKGSTHGYDVTDPNRVRAELGGEDAFRELALDAHRRGMGILLDIVPNHMAASVENAWWRDVLEHGRRSSYARFFDIDWERSVDGGADKVTLPVLGKPYDEALAAGDLELALENGRVVLVVEGAGLPLAPETTAEAAELLAALPGQEPSAAQVPALLARQHWRLLHWRDADLEVNYRRFFAINDLVGVRVEDPEVFAATHELVRRLVEEELVTGLRVDHVDGLADPKEYLDRLRHLAPECYIVVEKILARGERLPDDWPVQGTTGYDFLGMTNGLFVDPAGLAAIEAHYGRVTGMPADFDELAYRRKRAMARAPFAGEVAALTRRLETLAREDPRGVDLGEEILGRALVEATACLPVYRTYVRNRPLSRRDLDYLTLAILEGRRRAPDIPDAAFDVLGSILTLEGPAAVDPAGAGGGDAIAVVRRWQQLSGAIMAKGVEDTAFFRYNPVISLNEVGSDPAFGTVSRAEFATWLAERSMTWPHAMNATSTHDTKRSEDVRMRIAALSHVSDRWIERLDRWRGLNERHVEVVDGERAPSAAREISLYQTLLGAWPLEPGAIAEFRDRIAAYLPKAIREAKIRSRWEDPDTDYEGACVRFALKLLEGAEEVEAAWDTEAGAVAPEVAARRPFLSEFVEFQKEVALRGAQASLELVALKTSSPGVPDFFQGTELPTLTLVDPDNRRPVDYTLRVRLLAEMLAEAEGRARLGAWPERYEGLAKLGATRSALRARRAARDAR
jgi:(1->4)-alpha-D-glucan 1-alpha-D-glucosylmutase